MVRSNGSFFWDGQNGQFEVPFDEEVPGISPIRAAGFWMGGIDPAGNLKGAIQTYNENGRSDYQPGLLSDFSTSPPGQPLDFNEIWRVTRADIEAHIEDFQDNGVIDMPRPAIYGWPGRDNPYFTDYYDLDLPSAPNGLAPYWDFNGDGRYNPDDGDYPVLEVRGCVWSQIPDEMLWFAFHDVRPHTQSGMDPMQMEIQCTVFAYECSELETLNNSLFVRAKFISRAIESIDSTYIGFFQDVELGCPDDDHIASSPDLQSVMVYNYENEDENCNGFTGYGVDPPVVTTTFISGPLDDSGENLGMSSFMPVYPENTPLLPSGMQMPTTPAEYFHNLSCSWRDGSPLTFGDDGYQGTEPVCHIYSGDPASPDEWSEYNSGRPAGKRRFLSASGPFRIDPGAVNELLMGFTFYREPGNSHLQNIQTARDSIALLFNMFGNCVDPPQPWLSCSQMATGLFEHSSINLQVLVAPNPVYDRLEVSWVGTEVQQVELYNNLGILLRQDRIENVSQWSRSVGDLPPGVYLLRLETEQGSRVEKVLIGR